MIEFGNSLRAAREARGYTVRQLAELTRLAPSTIQELEAENFTRIAAPIYGRGFIKLYCGVVGLDPKPLIAEFMEIYNGTKDTSIKERPLPGAQTTAAEPGEDVPAASVEVPAAGVASTGDVASAADQPPESSLFDSEPESVPPVQSADAPFAPPEPSLSRYAAPVRQAGSTIDFRAYLRLGVLAIGALVLLAVIFVGIRAVYHATTKPQEVRNEPAAEAFSATPAPEPVKKAPPPAKAEPVANKTARTPQKIPSLYID